MNKCGKRPVIPNAKVSAREHVHENGDIVPIVCEEGFHAQSSNLTCREGNWSSAGALEKICTRKSHY